MSPWKKLRHRLEAAACGFFAWLVPRWTRGTCVRVANGLGEFAYHLDRRGRAVGFANLEAAFGDTLTPAQRADILRASYRNFARTMIDLFWAPALVRPENRHYLRVHGAEELNARAVREKRGALCLSIHAGNWEWGSLSCGFIAPALAVAEEFKNPAIAPFFLRARQASGQEIIPQENSMLRMLRAVKRGGRAAFLADLGVHPAQAATIVRVFGLEISASILHGILAQRGNALLALFENRPNRDGSMDATIEILDPPPGASPREIAQLCWDHFEPLLRREPGLWLWPYKHFRYRPRHADRPYPFYANDSGAFEKLRKRELGQAESTQGNSAPTSPEGKVDNVQKLRPKCREALEC